MAGYPRVWLAGGASVAETARGEATNVWVTPAGLQGALPHFDVRAYGAVGDGETDDTDAIQAAIDAAAVDHGTVLIPPQTFLYESFTLPASVKLQGCGTKLAIQLAFGTSVNWFDRTWVGGSVLQSSATSGKSITVDTPGADRQTHNLAIADVMIIGTGTGTAIGLSVGHPDQGTAAIRSRLERVTVGNFDTGAYLGLENSTVISLCAMGCNTGVLTGNAHNGNVHLGLNIEKCTDFGLNLVDAAGNSFVGGVFQGNTGTVIVLDDSHGNTFDGLYFENATATRDFDVQSDSLYNTIQGGHFVTGSEILLTGDGNRIINPQSSVGFAIVVDGQNNFLQGHFPIAPTLNAGATGTILIDTSNDVFRLREVALRVEGALDHDGTTVGFYGATPTAQQTGVAVSAAGIHAALVNLGLITA